MGVHESYKLLQVWQCNMGLGESYKLLVLQGLIK